MPEQIILEWAVDHLRVLELDDESRVRAAAQWTGTDHADTSVAPPVAGQELRRWLDEQRIGSGKATVVLPREAVVVRRLQLPLAPEEELPELVRFQAATKTSTPIDELALDFLVLQPSEESTGQDVVTFTIDRKRLTRITQVLEAAGLSPSAVTISPLSIATLVEHASKTKLGIHRPDLILFQQEFRIELSIFDEGTLVFSHSTVLPDGSDHLKPLQSELSRSLVALSQAHPGVSVDRCFYVGSGDESVLKLLEKRFPERFQQINTAMVLRGSYVGYEPLVGASLESEHRRLSIDLLHPRKREEAPDRRKLYLGAAATAVALLFLITYGIFLSQKNSLEASLEELREQSGNLSVQLKDGEPRDAAYNRIANWALAQADPIELWNEVRQHLPGTDRLYLSELRFHPQRDASLAKFTGVGFARQRADVMQMEQSLAENGFKVTPKATTAGREDPDYPVRFELDVELLRPAPPAQAAATGPPAVR